MIVTPFKSFAVLAAMFVAPAASQGTNATTLACGDTGKAYFRSTNELRAAVSCITTFQNCNSTDLPESSRTTLSDLGVLGAVLETGSLDAVLDGRDVDAQVLTNALGGDVWKELQVNSIIDQLFKDLEALVIALLDLLINLLEGLRGSFGPLSTWCVGSLTNLDNVFAGLKDFNAPLDWDVSNVTSFVGTFKDATAFNQDLSSWNLNNACDLTSMFEGATSFAQDWQVDLSQTTCPTTPVTTNMFKGTACEQTDDSTSPTGPVCKLATDVTAN